MWDVPRADKTIACTILVAKGGNRPRRDLAVNGRIILKWILGNLYWRPWIGTDDELMRK